MSNPFLDTLCYPLDWNALTPDKLPAALDEGLALSAGRLSALENLPLDETHLTYKTLMEGLGRMTEELDQTWGLAHHLSMVLDSPVIRKVIEDYTPKVSGFYASIGVSGELWERIKYFSKSREARKLQKLQKRHLELTVRGFKRSGADLNPEGKKEFVKIEEELSQVCEKFSKTILDSQNAFEKYFPLGCEETLLKGLPASALEMANTDAKAKGKEGYRFTLAEPSHAAIATYADDAGLRKEFFEARGQVGRQAPYNTEPFIRRILELRQKRSRLLGFKTYADYATQTRMLNNPGKIQRFLKELAKKVRPLALRDFSQIESLKRELGGLDGLEPWDNAYYREKLLQRTLAFDNEKLRPYFEFNAVRESLFALSQKLLGIKFRKLEGLSSWEKGVEYFEVIDEKTGRLMGGFYTDFFPRESKRSGAWHNGLRQCRPDKNGKLMPSIAVIVGNFNPPTEKKPALLSHYEVTTFYHEFGHLLHDMLTEVPIPSLAGTAVALDFVELPSQLMENFCYDANYLPMLGRHYQTREMLPAEIIDKLRAYKKFMLALFINRQLSFGALDMGLHVRGNVPADIQEAAEELQIPFRLPYHTQPPASAVWSFGHLWSGEDHYAAGYYSYQWCNVLEADIWQKFEKEGILSPKVGQDYREAILARGNSDAPERLFKDFMGREPKIEAYLKRIAP